jgi:enoyl-CoA hydratase/carnithine racemase
MAGYETIIYERVEDKIFRLTLNRPEKLNAMSQRLLGELDRAFDEFEEDPAASVLIIRGADPGEAIHHHPDQSSVTDPD